MTDDGWYGGSLWDSVAEDSVRRRADPRSFLAEVLETVWRFADSADQAFATWRRKVGETPWFAEDGLAVLQAVLHDPPADLGAFIRKHANVGTEAPDPDDTATLGASSPLDWLTRVADRFQAIFDAVVIERRS